MVQMLSHLLAIEPERGKKQLMGSRDQINYLSDHSHTKEVYIFTKGQISLLKTQICSPVDFIFLCFKTCMSSGYPLGLFKLQDKPTGVTSFFFLFFPFCPPTPSLSSSLRGKWEGCSFAGARRSHFFIHYVIPQGALNATLSQREWTKSGMMLEGKSEFYGPCPTGCPGLT